ncbi:MAG: hypothetical protein NXI14_11450 [bacterium]|nr:hypothetical protein [bacterium]
MAGTTFSTRSISSRIQSLIGPDAISALPHQHPLKHLIRSLDALGAEEQPEQSKKDFIRRCLRWIATIDSLAMSHLWSTNFANFDFQQPEKYGGPRLFASLRKSLSSQISAQYFGAMLEISVAANLKNQNWMISPISTNTRGIKSPEFAALKNGNRILIECKNLYGAGWKSAYNKISSKIEDAATQLSSYKGHIQSDAHCVIVIGLLGNSWAHSMTSKMSRYCWLERVSSSIRTTLQRADYKHISRVYICWDEYLAGTDNAASVPSTTLSRRWLAIRNCAADQIEGLHLKPFSVLVNSSKLLERTQAVKAIISLPPYANPKHSREAERIRDLRWVDTVHVIRFSFGHAALICCGRNRQKPSLWRVCIFEIGPSKPDLVLHWISEHQPFDCMYGISAKNATDCLTRNYGIATSIGDRDGLVIEDAQFFQERNSDPASESVVIDCPKGHAACCLILAPRQQHPNYNSLGILLNVGLCLATRKPIGFRFASIDGDAA